MAMTIDTQQPRRFAALLYAEAARPELRAWATTLTAAAMTIRHLADDIDDYTTQALRTAAEAAPSIEAAEAMGAKGGPAVEAERLAFEAWMRGHCWSLCATWDGSGYRSDAEQGYYVCPYAMRTRYLWAAWRDRAALTRAEAVAFGGYVIQQANGYRWRTLDSIGMLDWTDDEGEALRFALRKHADAFAGDDPEDVRIMLTSAPAKQEGA